jgi:hypothetical protein
VRERTRAVASVTTPPALDASAPHRVCVRTAPTVQRRGGRVRASAAGGRMGVDGHSSATTRKTPQQDLSHLTNNVRGSGTVRCSPTCSRCAACSERWLSRSLRCSQLLLCSRPAAQGRPLPPNRPHAIPFQSTQTRQHTKRPSAEKCRSSPAARSARPIATRRRFSAARWKARASTALGKTAGAQALPIRAPRRSNDVNAGAEHLRVGATAPANASRKKTRTATTRSTLATSAATRTARSASASQRAT